MGELRRIVLRGGSEIGKGSVHRRKERKTIWSKDVELKSRTTEARPRIVGREDEGKE